MDKTKIQAREIIRRGTLKADSQSEIDAENMVVRNVSFSSDEILDDPWFGKLKLSHKADAVNMDRAEGGNLPMMDNHNNRLGLIKNFRVENGKTRGDAHFSQAREASKVIFADIAAELLAETSIRAKLEAEHIIDRGDYFEATRWAPVEGSFVDIPADHTTGVNRNLQGAETMPKENTPGASENNDGAGQDFNNFMQARDAGVSEGADATRDDIKRNMAAIDDLFQPWVKRGQIFVDAKEFAKNELMTTTRAQSLLQECIDRAFQAKNDIGTVTRQQNSGSQYSVGQSENPYIERGAEDLDKKIDGMQKALEFRAQREIVRKITPAMTSDSPNQMFKGDTGKRLTEQLREMEKGMKENPFTSYGLLDLARSWAELARINTKGLSQSQLVGQVFIQRDVLGHSTGSFTSLLENITNKSLQVGYEEAAETWQRWCSIGELANFLQGSRPALSAFSDLDELPDGGEIKEGTFTDIAEKIQLATFAKLFSISRQAIINDDASGFSQIPVAMGRAANRKVGDTVYGHLINGHTRTLDQDGVALFAAGHSNYIASGSGGAPADATVQAAKTSMATQTDPSGNATLNIMLQYMLVPWALVGTATKLQKADYDPTASTLPAAPNIHQGTFEAIAEARLDADSATKWYMAANAMQVGTMEVAFLNGNQAPMLEQVNAWNTDGVKYKVIHDHAAEPLDFRGLYLNWGA